MVQLAGAGLGCCCLFRSSCSSAVSFGSAAPAASGGVGNGARTPGPDGVQPEEAAIGAAVAEVLGWGRYDMQPKYLLEATIDTPKLL